MSKIAETKLVQLTKYDELAPAAIQLGALAHMVNFVTGPVPTAWTGFTPLGGMVFPQGTDSNNRIGNYIYLRKSHLNLEIDTKQVASEEAALPTEFRVIVYRARRAVYPAGTTKDPAQSLFLDEVGNDFGHASSGTNGTDIMLQPVNRRLFTVAKDMKFCLSNPLSTANATGYSGHYPCMKRMIIPLPFYKKAHFEGTDSPEDVDFHWAVSIYARSLDKDQKADNWEVNTRGNTQFSDL